MIKPVIMHFRVTVFQIKCNFLFLSCARQWSRAMIPGNDRVDKHGLTSYPTPLYVSLSIWYDRTWYDRTKTWDLAKQMKCNFYAHISHGEYERKYLLTAAICVVFRGIRYLINCVCALSINKNWYKNMFLLREFRLIVVHHNFIFSVSSICFNSPWTNFITFCH